MRGGRLSRSRRKRSVRLLAAQPPLALPPTPILLSALRATNKSPARTASRAWRAHFPRVSGAEFRHAESRLSQGIGPVLHDGRARRKVLSATPSDRLRRKGNQCARARGALRRRVRAITRGRSCIALPDGRLVQLPVSWYAERGGYWAMSPGYDRPAHLDFRRVIDAGCMSCHNGYPRAPVRRR